MHFANIVENSDEGQGFDVRFGETHRAAERTREIGDAVDMTVKVLHHILHRLQ
jgi:hypothetical protein